VPDFSTLCRRQKTITIQIPFRRTPGPLNLLVDSTGIRFLGDGEWLARKHGTRRRRQYCMFHLAMDTTTGDIRAVEFTPGNTRDSPMLPSLLDWIPADDQIGIVTGDGAFDTRRCHTVTLARGGTAIIPIRRNARLWKEDCATAQRHPAGNPTQAIFISSQQWLGHDLQHRIIDRLAHPLSVQGVIATTGADAKCLQRATNRVHQVFVATDHRLPMSEQQSYALASVMGQARPHRD